jgi:hypothetical protein
MATRCAKTGSRTARRIALPPVIAYVPVWVTVAPFLFYQLQE